MSTDKPPASPAAARTTRQRVLAAAERLLESDRAGFSMRDLAAEAGVSFATPFNQFGSKAAILQALSDERIGRMQARLTAAGRPDDAPSAILVAVAVATAVMLEKPTVNRAVMAGLGSPSGQPGVVWARSRALWAEAMGEGQGLAPGTAALAREALPGQLALNFRGVLSFWAAGEISDLDLPRRAAAGAAALLLGFVPESRRGSLERLLSADGPPRAAS